MAPLLLPRAARKGSTIIGVTPQVMLGLVVAFIILLLIIFGLMPKLFGAMRGSENERLMREQFSQLSLRMHSLAGDGNDFSRDIVNLLPPKDSDFTIVGFDSGEAGSPVMVGKTHDDGATWTTIPLQRPLKLCDDPARSLPGCLCLYQSDELVKAKDEGRRATPVECALFTQETYFTSRIAELMVAGEATGKYPNSASFRRLGPFNDARLQDPARLTKYYKIFELWRVQDASLPLTLYVEKSIAYAQQGGAWKQAVVFFVADYAEALNSREKALHLCPAPLPPQQGTTPAFDPCDYKHLGEVYSVPSPSTACTQSMRASCVLSPASGRCEQQCVMDCFSPTDLDGSRAITVPCVCDGKLAYEGTCARRTMPDPVTGQLAKQDTLLLPKCIDGEIVRTCLCGGTAYTDGYCTVDGTTAPTHMELVDYIVKKTNTKKAWWQTLLAKIY